MFVESVNVCEINSWLQSNWLYKVECSEFLQVHIGAIKRSWKILQVLLIEVLQGIIRVLKALLNQFRRTVLLFSLLIYYVF